MKKKIVIKSLKRNLDIKKKTFYLQLDTISGIEYRQYCYRIT